MSRRGTKRILVIDDDLFFSKVLAQLLERCGYEVTVAHNGTEGIDCYRKELPDLVITDLRMPEKDGLETIAELQSEFSDSKVIAISGGDPQNLPIARKLGARHTFVKPFDTEELLETIEEELGMSV
jgi:CheY-like chemotaxis protein